MVAMDEKHPLLLVYCDPGPRRIRHARDFEHHRRLYYLRTRQMFLTLHKLH